MQITGVIQAGGRSTRMGGEPKALMDVAGKRIVERVANTLAAVLDDLLIVTNTPERYEFLHLPMVADRYPDGGALGGIFSGLAAARGAGAGRALSRDQPQARQPPAVPAPSASQCRARARRHRAGGDRAAFRTHPRRPRGPPGAGGGA